MESYLINYRRLFVAVWWICKHLRGSRCHMLPRGLSTGPQHLPPSSGSLRRSPCLTLPTIPLEKKGIILTERMCQATAAAPLVALNPHNPKPPPTGLTK